MTQLVLPMEFRRHGNPFGYVHGQINHENIRHPGYDLNWGPDGWADEGRPLFSPADSLIVFSGKASGWGTLIVGLIAHKVDLPEGGQGWLGWRFGHPKDLHVQAGQRVKAGDLVGTCGNGGNGRRGQKNAMLPHLHYDLFRRAEFERYGNDIEQRYGLAYKNRLGLPWTYWDNARIPRHNFKTFFVDPKLYHPELDRLI